MPDPFISVVIPTRDRPDTLGFCLETLRASKSSEIEIVVQDNFSGPHTKKVVEEARKLDGRIRHERTRARASQRENFELGLRACRGTYLTIIGDDDGFLPDALDWLADTLKVQPVDAVRWNLLKYVWPNLSTDGEGFLELYPDKCTGEVQLTPAGSLRHRALNAMTEGSWDNLLIYHGMINRRIYERMRSFTDGVFFNYPMPDVYAHTLLPFFCDNYLNVNDYLTVYGLSAHSAGSSWTNQTAVDGATQTEAKRWMDESRTDARFNSVPWYPDIRTQRFHEMKVLDFAERRGQLGGLKLDRQLWERAVLAEVKRAPSQLAGYAKSTPSSEFDRAIFSAVLGSVTEVDENRRRYRERRFSPDDRIPSLRPADFDPSLADNVAGAMHAVDMLAGSLKDRIKPLERLPVVQRSSATVFGAFVRKLQRHAPVFAANLANHRLMPTWLWRRLKSLQSGRHVSAQLVSRMELVHKKHLERTS